MATATKTVYIYLAGSPSAFTWSTATAAQVADLVTRWDAVRNGDGPDLLTFTQAPYVYRIDLTRVSALMVA